MVGAQHPLAGGEGLLVQGEGVGGAARGLIGAGEVVPRGQGVGVIGAQDPLAAGGGTDKTSDDATGSIPLRSRDRRDPMTPASSQRVEAAPGRLRVRALRPSTRMIMSPH